MQPNAQAHLLQRFRWCLSRGFWALCSAGLLLGCASAPVSPASALFADAQFPPVAGLVIESRHKVFALPADLQIQLQADAGAQRSTAQRLQSLVGQLYSETGGVRLDYSSGHSTGAAQTWADKRGDCLSLTILAYSAAQTLGIEAVMQEVPGPALIDRRGEIDFVNGHVNLLVPTRREVRLGRQLFEPGGFVVDFQPHSALRAKGTPLDEDAVLARFYNNRASELLTQGQTDAAYWYYRAAAALDARYAPIFSNLAQLYLGKGLLVLAESALRHAIALNGNTDTPLKSLRQLLLAQGRLAEAAQLELDLRRWQDSSPYYWLERGRAELVAGRAVLALAALEQALSLASGFAELHYLLALAYARTQQPELAHAQLETLRTLLGPDPVLARLSRKIQPEPGPASHQ